MKQKLKKKKADLIQFKNYDAFRFSELNREIKTMEAFSLEYEYLMLKAHLASLTAAQYLLRKDYKMVTFYLNASEGFRLRAINLEIFKD